MVELDRDIEDERDEDPGVDFSTEAYEGGEEAEELADEAIDKGIARFECPSQRNRLVKVLSILQELQHSYH